MFLKKPLFLFFLIITVSASAGTVDTLEIQSTQLKKTTKVVVIKPTALSEAKETYPVIYLLHGYGGNYAQWSKISPQLSKTADDLKVIFVCPDGGTGSWYFDR